MALKQKVYFSDCSHCRVGMGIWGLDSAYLVALLHMAYTEDHLMVHHGC